MNRNKIARELTTIAKALVAASDIELTPYYAKMAHQVGMEVAKSLRSIKGVEDVDTRENMIGGSASFTITLTGYTRSDFEAEAQVFLNFGIKMMPHVYFVEGKRADWGGYAERLEEGKFTDKVPLRKIEGTVKRIFG